jgi:hypothetical protein
MDRVDHKHRGQIKYKGDETHMCKAEPELWKLNLNKCIWIVT